MSQELIEDHADHMSWVKDLEDQIAAGDYAVLDETPEGAVKRLAEIVREYGHDGFTKERESELMVMMSREGVKPAAIAEALDKPLSTTYRELAKCKDSQGEKISTQAENREAVADAIAANPNASNREIERVTGVSNPTVAKVRKELSTSEVAPGITADELEELKPQADVFDKYRNADCEINAGGDGGFKDAIKAVRSAVDSLTYVPTADEIRELETLRDYITERIQDAIKRREDES